MMARSHVVVGAAAWVATAPLLHLPPTAPLYLGLAVVGSLLPDLDHPKSWVGRRTRPLSTLTAAMLGHRGVTHSALAVLGLVLLLRHEAVGHGAIAALAIGYASHLAADMMTPQGLRLIWPLRGSWAIPLCRTGSPAEALIVVSLAGAVAWWRFGAHGR